MAMQRLLVLACALAVAGAALEARAGPQATERTSSSTASTASTQGATFSKDEIAQLVAPVALYPDSLLAQVLMATTYPSDVADAAKWAESHKDMKGDAAVKAVANEPWDASVQSLASFPQVLLMMGGDINWVTKLGDAFLAQPNDVMAMAQELRKKAQTAGNLKSNEYQKVSSENPQTIVIEPTSTQTVYVPTYDPNTVYGSWGYMYPPYYYPPSPYYYPGYAFGAGLAWGVGIGISIGFWGDCDWGGGDVNINNSRYNEFNRDINRGDRQLGDGSRGDRGGNSRFQHDGSRRDGVPYRDQASRDKYGNRQAGGASRDQFRGENANRSAQRDSARQQMERQGMDPARNNQQARDRASQASRDPRSSNIGQSNSYRQSGANNAASRDLARSSGGGYGGNYGNSRNNAFSGASNSGASRAASNRGSSSRSNMSRGGGSAGRSMSRPSRGGGGGGRRR